MLKKIFVNIFLSRIKKNDLTKYEKIFNQFQEYTMIPKDIYIQNLLLINTLEIPDGVVVECGVWKGGMSAGISKILKDRTFYLFDSFKGLPAAKEIDGKAALAWQSNKDHPGYHDNCSAEESFAKDAMSRVTKNFFLIKGLFSETLPQFNITDEIAVLRLDGDWYDSTYDCFQYLYPKVTEGGVVLIDDYFAWDGCSKAVHDYLSERKSSSRIRTCNGVCYIIKNEEGSEYNI